VEKMRSAKTVDAKEQKKNLLFDKPKVEPIPLGVLRNNSNMLKKNTSAIRRNVTIKEDHDELDQVELQETSRGGPKSEADSMNLTPRSQKLEEKKVAVLREYQAKQKNNKWRQKEDTKFTQDERKLSMNMTTISWNNLENEQEGQSQR
jgi:hypothetical protein